MRALITGVNGFVGRHLAEYLLDQSIEVWGTTRKSLPSLIVRNGTVKLYSNNLDNTTKIYNMLEEIEPTLIFHLAGQSNVKESWLNKEETFYINVNKTIFLLDACQLYQMKYPNVKILTVGSSEEYGYIEQNLMPIKEEYPLNPLSPYGASKAAISNLIKQYYRAYGLNIVHVRPFNHIGPGQSEGFVTADFAKQIVEIELGIKEPVLKVGNLTAKRDFTDVRDIVRGYYMLINADKFGNIFNLCSQNPISVMEILNILISYSQHKSIQIITDNDKLRPSDIPLHFGSFENINKITNWMPIISLETSLKDILNGWRNRLLN